MVFLKLFHLFFLFLWIGSLLSLTHLGKSSDRKSLQRLYLCVDLPAMILALTLGITLFILKGANFKEGWFHMKLTFVTLLVVIDILVARCILAGRSKYFTLLNILTLTFLCFILFSVYVLKNRSELSLAKKESLDYDPHL